MVVRVGDDQVGDRRAVHPVALGQPGVADRQRLDDAIATLEQQGLYPLPDKRYTRKYWMFRRLVQSKMGRSLLLHIVR